MASEIIPNIKKVTLRQVINNHPWARKINQSEKGKSFQNSKFAKYIEAHIYSAGEMAEYIKEGVINEGIFKTGLKYGILSPILLIEDIKERKKLVNSESILVTRPDLNGTIDPKYLGDALKEEIQGRSSMEDILNKYKPRFESPGKIYFSPI